MAHSDSELIKRTLGGDETAFGFLVDKYKGAVHALAYRKIGDFHTAEEITQDTFLQAYQKLSTLKDWRRFPGWLYTIASRFCLMWHRKNRLPMQSIDAVETHHVDALAQARYADARTRETVHDALEELPESQRTVLTLHYLGGMKCEEIARFMGTSRGAILDRLYRARLQLKKELIPMMRQTLGAFQLPPTFTTRIMNRIDQFRPTSTPVSKPLTPWLAAMAALVVALYIGLGQQLTTRSQRPYSLDAPDSTVQVELIDAPAIYRPETKPALANRPGQSNSKNGKPHSQPDGAVLGAASTVSSEKGLNDSEWVQTNGPSGGEVTNLFRASDGALYAATTSPGIFRSDNNGDTWISLHNDLDVYRDGYLPFVHAITEADGVIYLKDYESFFYSYDHGESWRWVKFPDQFETATAFAVSGERIYVGKNEDGVVYSDDYGESWTPLSKGMFIKLREMLKTVETTPIVQSLSIKPPDKLITVGTTLFAKRGDNLFRLKAGEESWTSVAHLKDLRFFTATGDALVIGSQFDLRRSTDEGGSWVPMTGKIRLRSWEDQNVKVDVPWSRAPVELEFRSLSILGIAGFEDAIYVLLSDGGLLRSTENGIWDTTETGLTGLEMWNMNDMVALSRHAVCIATSEGVLRWTDDEQSWKRINEGIINTYVYDIVSYKDALYATTGHTIVKSVDGGDRWIPVHRGLPVTQAWAFAIADGQLYLGLSETNMGRRGKPFTAGIYRLADGQSSWIPVQMEMRTDDIDHPKKKLYPSFERLYSVDELVISGDTFYAIAQMGNGLGVYQWRKGERFWTSLSLDVEHGSGGFWSGLAVSDKTIYFDASENLLCSNNLGETWSRIDTFPGQNDPSKRLDGHAVMGDVVYISISELGIFRSTNHGKTWESINEGLPEVHSWELYTVEDTIYATAWEAGIFRFKNERNSWELVKPSFPFFRNGVNSMVVVNNTLYAATGGLGVHRMNLGKPAND